MKHLFSLLSLCIFLFFSCDVTIPEEDTTPPRFSITISEQGNDSDGKRHEINNETPNAELTIRSAKAYTLLCSFSDNGGVEYASISAPKKDSLVVFEINEWVKVQDSTKTTFELTIDEAKAKNIQLGVGAISAFGNDQFKFSVDVKDFGGEEKKVNTTLGIFTVKVSSTATESSCDGCAEKK